MFKKAFTLAEILIVMAIIGTVAVATIPNLVDSYKEERDVAKLRKVYHDIEVAFAKSVAEYGPTDTWSSNYATRINIFTKYLKATPCGNEKVNNCYPSNVTGNSTTYYKYELEDGVGISVLSLSSGMYWVMVALDGAKGKVVNGRNIFRIAYSTDNGIYPYGKGSDRESNGAFKTSIASNYYVTNWVITNGNMDYLKCASQLNWTNQTSCP